MQYFPTLTGGQFQVCIGQTAQCSIALGSHSVTGTGVGVSWAPQNLPMARTGVVWSGVECQPYGFTAADVGRRIIIFGAGVAGGLLVSNITAVADAFNCTIADAAATAVPWAAGANMTVYRPYGTVLGSLKYDLSLTTLGTWGFSIQYDPQHPVLKTNIVPVTRQPVLLLTSNPDFSEPAWSPGYTAYGRDGLTAIIGGTVNQVQLTSAVSGGSLVQADVECSNILCAKRVMAGTSWASAAAGKIAEDITGSLNPAGDCIGFVCGGGASPTTYGPTLTDYSVDPWTFVADALDSLMTAISTGAEPYYWTITPWRVVYMGKSLDSVAAPWSASDTDGSDGNVLIQVSKTDTLEKYANNVYLEASHILADTVSNEAFSGDGTKREFQTSQPIAITPQIQVNLAGHGYVADTSIGVYNVDSGYHWYWSPDSNSVYQDASQTVLGTHDAVAVIYFASSAGLGYGADTIGSEAASASIEGGSGKHDMTDSTDVPMTVDAATLMAELEADYYGVVPETFEAQTLRGGLAPGQAWPVHITEIGAVDANYANPNPISYLISEVSMSCGSDNTVTWDVKAVASPLIGGWLKAMRDWANRSTKGVKLGSMNPASGSEFATLVSAYTITAPTLISVAEVDGDILFVGITQDATGHAVTWDTMFVGAPAVPTTPLSVTNATFVGVAGNWEISSTNVPTTGVPPPPIATATGSITGYDNHGLNATYPTFAGSITLPTGDPDYSHDRYLEVFAVSPTGDETQIFRDVYPYSSAVAGVLAYTGWDISIPQTGSDQTGWTIRIRTYNEYYTPSTPKDITGLTIAAPTITSVTAVDENGSGSTTDMSWVDTSTAKHCVVGFIPGGVSNFQMNVLVWIDKGHGAGKEFQGWDLMSSVGQTLYIGAQRTDNGGSEITISPYLTTGVQNPPTDTDETWTLYVAPWIQAVAESGVCPGYAVSCTFTMHKTAAPASSGIINATAGPSTTMGPNSEGIPYWSIPISFTTPGMGPGGNQNCRGFAVTVNITDASGNEAPVEQGGGEVIMAEPPNDGSTYTPDPLVGPFNPAGSIYTYIQFKVYAPGLDAGDSWNTGTQTLQSIAWNGGAAATSVLVNFGQPPDGMIPLTRVNPETIGTGMTQDPSTKKLMTAITGPLYADVNGNTNIRIASDFTVSGSPATLTQAAVDLAKAVNFGGDFTKAGGIFAVNAIAVNKLLAGDALFYGQATFAYAGGGKVTINSLGLALANSNTSPTATFTLTASGATIANGSNSLALDSTGLTAADQSGNSLTLKTAGVRIVRGSTNMLLSAGGLLVTDAYGNTLSLGPGGVTVSNGTSSVAVAVGGVTIVNGKLTSPTITGGSLIITTSTALVTINSGSTGIAISPTSSAGVGLTVTYGGLLSQLAAGFLTLGSGGSYTTLSPSAINVGTSQLNQYDLTINGVNCIDQNGRFIGAGVACPYSQIVCSSLLIGFNTAIDSLNRFVGNGIVMLGAGITATGFNPYVGGIQYTGAAVDITFKDSAGGYCTLNGSVVRQSFKGGVLVGLL